MPFGGAADIHYQMHVPLGRPVGFDGPQELQELAAAVTSPMQIADQLVGGDVKGRKQRLGGMAHVVV